MLVSGENAIKIAHMLKEVNQRRFCNKTCKHPSFQFTKDEIRSVIRAWLKNVCSDVVVVVGIRHKYYFGCAPHMRDGYGTVACVQLDVETGEVHEVNAATREQLCTLLKWKVVFADSKERNGIYTGEISPKIEQYAT